ncbi:MAG TPA: acyltransferase family protein [Luteimonas sp.]|nr:acyltransferase family protein [Luteimonas sp.]
MSVATPALDPTPQLPDIQLLRAVAVAMVVLFHLWPGVVPGGFAGVDVFFVISGFLITAHLERELEATGTVALRRFWARRIARLLPAALLVLAVTLLAARAWLPATQWAQTAREAAASALYVENWVLAAASVDYFAASKAATALQHYWSLSVEEQFYLAWPLLLLAGARIARGRRRRALATTLSLVIIASLAWSLLASRSVDPGYFSTFVRAWEFAAGGLLAVILARRQGQRAPLHPAALRGAGFVALLATALVLHGDLAFPGWVALLPVAGTLAVIAAAAHAVPDARAPRWPMRLARGLGDIAYPVYLWHWPLLVVAPYALQAPLGPGDRAVLLAATLALAWLTARTIEHRFRPYAAHGRAVWPVYAGAAVATLLVVGGSIALERAAGPVNPALPAARTGHCAGAAAMRTGSTCPDRHRAPPAAAALAAQADGGALWLYNRAQVEPYYRRTCTWADEAQRCTFPRFGDDALEVLLIGDSHMLQYVPAIAALARANRWNLRYALSLGCPAAHLQPGEDDGTAPTAVCRRWREQVPHAIAGEGADLVVAISSTRRYARGVPGAMARLPDALQATWAHWRAAGNAVLVVVDNPIAWTASGDPVHVPDCIAAAGARPDPCAVPRSRALAPDPVDVALSRMPSVPRFDPNWAFCDPMTCHFAVGGQVTHLDPDHVTATFNLGLMPELGAAILSAAGRDPDLLVVPTAP